jgi:hypothetical protein
MLSAVAVLTVAFGFMATGCERRQESTVSGQAGKQLTIHQPGAVTIVRGGTAKVKVVVNRQKLEGPVAITFVDLPVGVTVAAADMKIVGDEGTYDLMATDAAQLVGNHRAKVTAMGAEGISASVDLVITVEEKK